MFTVWVLMIITSYGNHTFDYADRESCVKNAVFIERQSGVTNAFCFPVNVPAPPKK